MRTKQPTQPLDKRDTMPASRDRLVELRGASGKLYAKLNPQTLELEFQDGKQIERIRLSDHLPPA